MPYYRITIKIRKKITTGIRELSNANIDYAWRYYEKKAFEKYHDSDIEFFEVVMISKLSKEVKNLLGKDKRVPADEG